MGVEFLKSAMFRRFATKRPMAVMIQMAFSHLMEPESLDRLFAENAQQQYKHKLAFSALAELTVSVVLRTNPSVHAAYKRMQDRLGVTHTATYNKLDRVETGLSQALVRHSYEQAVAVREGLGVSPQQDLPGYDLRILDGNHLSATEHRLKETRDTTAAPLPGKSLVVMSPGEEAICDYFPIEDGHAQERSAIDAVLETVRRDQLWVADRNFCTLKFLFGCVVRGAAFVVRQHAKLIGTHPGVLETIGTTETGTISEQSLRIPTGDGPTWRVRRIVVELDRPTRDGDRVIALLTNIPAQTADARKIAELYRGRWKIETAFFHLTEALTCEIDTLCYPKAALFCFANALVAYNAFAIVKAALAATHGSEAVWNLSHYYVALEIAETTDGMLIALPGPEWACFAEMSSLEFAAHLREVAAGMTLRNYRKSVRGPKKPKPRKKHHKQSVHVSTKNILDNRNKKSC